MRRWARVITSSNRQLRFFSQFLKQYIMPILVGLGAVFLAIHAMVIFLVSCVSFIFIAPQHNCMALGIGVKPTQSNIGQVIPWCAGHRAVRFLRRRCASLRWDRRCWIPRPPISSSRVKAKSREESGGVSERSRIRLSRMAHPTRLSRALPLMVSLSMEHRAVNVPVMATPRLHCRR